MPPKIQLARERGNKWCRLGGFCPIVTEKQEDVGQYGTSVGIWDFALRAREGAQNAVIRAIRIGF
jgi:hypothetical protein